MSGWFGMVLQTPNEISGEEFRLQVKALMGAIWRALSPRKADGKKIPFQGAAIWARASQRYRRTQDEEAGHEGHDEAAALAAAVAAMAVAVAAVAPTA